MKKIFLYIIGVLFILAAVFILYQSQTRDSVEDTAQASKPVDKAATATAPEKQPHNMGNINVRNVYAFATAANAKTGAVFLNIKNPSNAATSLVKARSYVADIVELHQNLIDPDEIP